MIKPLVFYLDDNQDALDLAQAITKSDERFTLVGYRTQEEFLKAVEDDNPKGVIIDLNLGENITGTIVSEKLRIKHPQLHIAIYTNYDKYRVSKFLDQKDLISGLVRVWTKSEVGVTNLADEIVEMITPSLELAFNG